MIHKMTQNEVRSQARYFNTIPATPQILSSVFHRPPPRTPHPHPHVYVLIHSPALPFSSDYPAIV